jgi:Tol biopolymer transport system component
VGTDGCPTTARVSLANAGGQGDSNSVAMPTVSNNGRFVLFASDATNLVTGDTNGVTDVFFRDTCFSTLGCTPSTVRASVSSSGTEGNGPSTNPMMSKDGRFIVFVSDADNLVSGDTNGVRDVFVRDTCRGASGCTPSTRRVSLNNNGNQANGPSFRPAISDDGRYIAFASDADNLVGSNDTNGVTDIFLHDTCRGASNCSASTRRLSVSTAGAQGNAQSLQPSMSADGRLVAFASDADNLVGSDTNGTRDVFLRDTCNGVKSGCTPATLRLSISRTGAQANGSSFAPYITRDGHFVVYVSVANDLVGNDINGVADVFLGRTGR